MTRYEMRVELDWTDMQTSSHSNGTHDYEHPAIRVYPDGVHTLPHEVKLKILDRMTELLVSDGPE